MKNRKIRTARRYARIGNEYTSKLGPVWSHALLDTTEIAQPRP